MKCRIIKLLYIRDTNKREKTNSGWRKGKRKKLVYTTQKKMKIHKKWRKIQKKWKKGKRNKKSSYTSTQHRKNEDPKEIKKDPKEMRKGKKKKKSYATTQHRKKYPKEIPVFPVLWMNDYFYHHSQLSLYISRDTHYNAKQNVDMDWAAMRSQLQRSYEGDRCEWKSDVQGVWVECLCCLEIDAELPNESIGARHFRATFAHWHYSAGRAWRESEESVRVMTEKRDCRNMTEKCELSNEKWNVRSFVLRGMVNEKKSSVFVMWKKKVSKGKFCSCVVDWNENWESQIRMMESIGMQRNSWMTKGNTHVSD